MRLRQRIPALQEPNCSGFLIGAGDSMYCRLAVNTQLLARVSHLLKVLPLSHLG
jgi:hypothetical protein